MWKLGALVWARKRAKPELKYHSSLRDEKKMRAILDRERARSDRSARNFTVVSFSLDVASTRQQWRRLVQLLTCSVRLTDEIGWLNGQLAALLPETGRVGGEHLARRVCDRFGGDANGLPAYEIVTYGPEARRDDDDEHHGPARPLVHDAADDALHEAAVPAHAALFVQQLPWWKRTTDIAVAFIALVVLSPLILLVALLVKVTSSGPVLFVQWRAGLGGRPFRMYKFRSMVVDAEVRKRDLMSLNEQDGPAFKMENDPRLTVVGRLLRSTSVDELPQLWNVLCGQMTLVGPRPLPCEEARGCQHWHQARCDVTPGLTCSWQIWGRSSVTFEQWMRMDLAYIRQRTPLYDFKLLAHTAAAVVARRGAK